MSLKDIAEISDAAFTIRESLSLPPALKGLSQDELQKALAIYWYGRKKEEEKE